MSLDDPNFPFQFLVGRSLAQRENVDDATATRLALVGSVMMGGLFGPVIARQLAIREAPAPAPLTVVKPPPGTPSSPPKLGSKVDVIVKQFEAFIKADKKAEADARARAAALVEQAQKLQQERAKMLADLCASLDILAKDPPVKSPPAAK